MRTLHGSYCFFRYDINDGATYSSQVPIGRFTKHFLLA